MLNEVQDHQVIKEETMVIELQPRVAILAGEEPEGGDDAADLRTPQASTENGNDQTGIMSSQDPGSIAPSVQLSPGESRVPGGSGQDPGNIEPQSHPDQEVVDEIVHPADLTDKTLLFKIKGLLIAKLHRARRDRGFLDGVELGVDDGPISFDAMLLETIYAFESSEIPEPLYWSAKSIDDAWPASRDIQGVGQYIIDSDGVTTKAQAHSIIPPWSPVRYQDTPYDIIENIWFLWCCAARKKVQQEVPDPVDNSYSGLRHTFKGKIFYCGPSQFRKGIQGFPIHRLACALSLEEPFRISSSEMNDLHVGKSTAFLSTRFRSGYNVEMYHDLHNTIHWQVRYFSPILEERIDIVKCLLSKRETATLQDGLEESILQEKRAVVSFRVLRKAPELFSILSVRDGEFIDIDSPDQRFDVNKFWKGYEFLRPEDITPLTHYLLEICRVFKMCMDAWAGTLNAIDRLVLVKLEDLDNLERLEELMFDNSFKRSKDYFLALQILRIIEGWLDEVQSTVKDMFKDPVLIPASMWTAGSAESFQVAIRYVDEQGTAIKSRVQKKQEEINSLRDGLFNATSLRESTKAMALNQAIYVFTVVTVLFTPVSFLATFWALPFLNNQIEGTDVVPVPAAFRNSFIIMPILTYALVIGVAWFVGQRNSVKAVFSILRELLKSAGRLLRFGWNLLRKKENICFQTTVE